MIHPLHLFRAARRYLPIELVSEMAFRLLEGQLEQVPDGFNWLTLECRLAGPGPVDFALCAQRSLNADQRLSTVLDAEIWGSSLPLLSYWCTGAGLQAVPQLWYEWDDEPSGRLRGPMVFTCVDPDFHAVHRRALTAAQVYEWCVLALQLQGVPVPVGLRFVLESLPAGARLCHIASLRHRGREAVRLDLSMPEEYIQSWLGDVGWSGGGIELLWSLLDRGRGTHNLELDLLEHVNAEAGGLSASHGHLAGRGAQEGLDAPGASPIWGQALGVLYGAQQQAQRPEGWRVFLQALVDAGLCSSKRAQCLLSWVGAERVVGEQFAWPLVVHRQLGVKVGLRANGQLQAKAYLSLLGQAQVF